MPLYPLPGGGRTRFQPIHVEDLAPMLAAALESDEHVGEVYEVERKGARIVPLPMPLARIGLAVLGAVPGFPMGGAQYRSPKFGNTTADNDAGAFGVDESEMTTLAGYLGVERPSTPSGASPRVLTKT